MRRALEFMTDDGLSGILMGVSNVLAGFLGGMPICHGSGGLTAHHRFGAQTAGADLIIGSFCLVGALFLTKPVLVLVSLLSLPVLGALLFYVGVQHALLVRDLQRAEDISVALLITAVVLRRRRLRSRGTRTFSFRSGGGGHGPRRQATVNGEGPFQRERRK